MVSLCSIFMLGHRHWQECVKTLPLCLPYSLFVLVSLLGCRWAELGGSSATWETPGPGVSQDKYTTSPFMEETLSMQTPLQILLCFLVAFWLFALAPFNTLHYHIHACKTLTYTTDYWLDTPLYIVLSYLFNKCIFCYSLSPRCLPFVTGFESVHDTKQVSGLEGQHNITLH